MDLPTFPGWHLVGQYESDVGSWLLHHGGEAMLLEIPEGLTTKDVRRGLIQAGSPRLKYVAASHAHEDHLDVTVWRQIAEMWPSAERLHPAQVLNERKLDLGGEPLWLVRAPKHSHTDVVTIFRGVAMTGDIELGMLDSVNKEVPAYRKRLSMAWLQSFPLRASYHVHSIVSAHLDDVRTGVDWPALFQV